MTLPGRSQFLIGSPGLGAIAITEGAASSSVRWASASMACRRGRMPSDGKHHSDQNEDDDSNEAVTGHDGLLLRRGLVSCVRSRCLRALAALMDSVWIFSADICPHICSECSSTTVRLAYVPVSAGLFSSQP